MVLMMLTGDFLAMSSSTDNVRPSEKPSVWRIGPLTVAGLLMGVIDLAFCVSCLAVGRFKFGLDVAALRTFTVVTLVFSGQAVFYVARERWRLWSSCPGKWLLISSVVDLAIVSILAVNGILMTALPIAILAGLFVAAIVFAFFLDAVKLFLFDRFQIG
jgi:H+-transporting ATPase